MCGIVCVLDRGTSGGLYRVTGGWLTSAASPGYWEFDVLHQKKETYKEVKLFLSSSVR